MAIAALASVDQGGLLRAGLKVLDSSILLILPKVLDNFSLSLQLDAVSYLKIDV